ncbi:hypothetical protein Q21_gp3 [Vibrio phage VPp1]|nr:hypothetical protein Q21_gp3 [Vibrio phage VPp1]
MHEERKCCTPNWFRLCCCTYPLDYFCKRYLTVTLFAVIIVVLSREY